MANRCSRITKAGVLVEPANPNSAEMFFKTANDWPRLSGYIGILPQLSQHASFSPKTVKSQLSANDLKSRVEESKVKPALSYLYLRDLGCSKEQAISFSRQKKLSKADITNTLPPKLRKTFKLKFSKKKAKSPEPSEIYETFESMSNGFKELIFKKKHYFESNCAEQEKYLQKIEKEVRSIKNFKTPQNEEPEIFQFFDGKGESEESKQKSMGSEQSVPTVTYQSAFFKDLENIAEEKINEEEALFYRSNDYFYSQKKPKITSFSPDPSSNFLSPKSHQNVLLSPLNNLRAYQKKMTFPSLAKEEQKILDSIRNIAKRKKNCKDDKFSKRRRNK